MVMDQQNVAKYYIMLYTDGNHGDYLSDHLGLTMQSRGISIGMPKTLAAIYVFLTLWGLIAVVTIIFAVAALPLPECYIIIMHNNPFAEPN